MYRVKFGKYQQIVANQSTRPALQNLELQYFVSVGTESGLSSLVPSLLHKFLILESKAARMLFLLQLLFSFRAKFYDEIRLCTVLVRSVNNTVFKPVSDASLPLLFACAPKYKFSKKQCYMVLPRIRVSLFIFLLSICLCVLCR